MKRVLFLCTNNSARSQMAEGLLRHLYGDSYEVFSAGTEPTQVHPSTIAVMKERGIDISNQKAKSLDPYIKEDFDYVVTVCDRAREACPFFAGGKEMLHQNFMDPAQASSTKDEILSTFRLVRDEIEAWLKQIFS